MSYHNVRNIEQNLSMEGQATAYGSSSDASMNEVMSELSKRHNHLAKQGGIGAEDSDAVAARQGGGLKDFASKGGGDTEFGEYCKKGIAADNIAIGKKDAEFANGEGFAVKGELKHLGMKNAEGQYAGGIGFAEKANNTNSWDRTLNNAMLGIGAALGPVGLPLVLTAEARMLQDKYSAKSYAQEGSSGLQKEFTQRQKMLKSWTLRDE